MSVFPALDPANQGLVGVLLQTKRSQHPVDRIHGTVKLPQHCPRMIRRFSMSAAETGHKPLDSYPTIDLLWLGPWGISIVDSLAGE